MLVTDNPISPNHPLPKTRFTHVAVMGMLKMMALLFSLRPSLKKYLKSDQGWINFTLGIGTENSSVDAAIVFKDGCTSVTRLSRQACDVTLIFNHDKAVRKLLGATPTEQIFMLMKSELRTKGNAAYMNLFFFLLSLLLNKKQIKQIQREQNITSQKAKAFQSETNRSLSDDLAKRHTYRMTADKKDSGVKYLDDPYLSDTGLENFPRIKSFLDIHFQTKPEICPERPKLITNWFKTHGFETDSKQGPWIPELRQGKAFKYLMENRQPIIRRNDLIAGTTTTKEIGVVVYPDSHGTMIWSELLTVAHRSLNPYDISEETRWLLHHEIFPYWADRNFKEWVRKNYDHPLGQKIDERFAVYFTWKQAALSHTIPDFPKILKLGAKGVICEIEQRLASKHINEQQQASLNAMIYCLQGMITYSKNLAQQAAKEALKQTNPVRKAELEKLARVCDQVIENPARTLDEAVNAVWILWVGLHMENTNAGLSLGRLDQWLQPYFQSDMACLKQASEKQDYIHHAVELVACLFMRCTDHLPLSPDLGNWYFGGSSSDQAITLGGITPGGEDGVNDMTYIILKVTEMLSIRDPNVNARFHSGKNSETYLKRLCEVNLITAGTPSLHNDEAIFSSLEAFDYPREALNDWAATGCVEPTLSGRHIGHTNFQMMNMVAPLEMALNNGRHPLMNWELGPNTGSVENDDFKSFDEFFNAFKAQFKFIIHQSIQYNDQLGKAHQAIRPTPLLSAVIDGCIKKGRDVTHGGAQYNTSGGACIGLADVVDSLLVIKNLVFDHKKISFKALKLAVDSNFKNDPALHALITHQIPFFGSGDNGAVSMANQVIRFAHDTYGAYTNYRGGRYTVGFWSMSNHVIYGTLSGTLPSGRLAGKPFTPGLTPGPSASKSLLDSIRDVASLDPKYITNNIAFNVKVVPKSSDTREQAVNNMFSYVKAYFQMGGMQMQMNVVTSETLKDALANPENYRNLIVRISGYNAYFVTLNRDLQMELIERAQYGI